MTKTSNVRFMTPKVSGVDPVELDPVVWGTPDASGRARDEPARSVAEAA